MYNININMSATNLTTLELDYKLSTFRSHWPIFLPLIACYFSRNYFLNFKRS